MRMLGASVVLPAAGVSLGQAGWVLTPEYEPGYSSVNPLAPTVRIVVSAYFPSNDYAFCAAAWDLVAGDSTWVNGSYYHPPPMSNPSGPYRIDGPRIPGLRTGQLNFPQANIFAEPRNPIPAFVADWVTDDFSPRQVEILTLRTGRFDVYPIRSSPASVSRLSVFAEGRVSITVTPAPAGAAALGAAGVVAFRRRRGAA